VRGLDPAPERRPPSQEADARSDFHGGKQEGKIDPSRERAAACDTHAGGRDDRHALREIVDDGGPPRDVAGGEIFPGNGDYSNAAHDHSEDTDKRPRHTEESDTPADERR